MREILFRGKRVDNGEWVEGVYFPENDTFTATIFNGKGNCVGDYVVPETVGQYTGLTANGKKIFEGDIVHNGAGDPGVVVWICGSFAIHFSDGEDWDVCQYVKEEYTEVIGNIYDNPEMLEVEE